MAVHSWDVGRWPTHVCKMLFTWWWWWGFRGWNTSYAARAHREMHGSLHNKQVFFFVRKVCQDVPRSGIYLLVTVQKVFKIFTRNIFLIKLFLITLNNIGRTITVLGPSDVSMGTAWYLGVCVDHRRGKMGFLQNEFSANRCHILWTDLWACIWWIFVATSNKIHKLECILTE